MGQTSTLIHLNDSGVVKEFLSLAHRVLAHTHTPIHSKLTCIVNFKYDNKIETYVNH